MNTLDILIAARAKIVQGWTQREYARHEDDSIAHPQADDAVRWCAVGAIRAVDRSTRFHETEDGVAAKILAKAMGKEKAAGIIQFNDHSTKEEVLEAFDLAIEKARLL